MTLPEPDSTAHAAIAKQRLLALTIMRLAGLALLGFALLVLTQKFDWVQGDNARKLGAILACAGLVQTLVIPRLLLRGWKSPQP
jgi:hypothetical protein